MFLFFKPSPFLIQTEKRQICFLLLKKSGVKSKSSKKETECCSTSLFTPASNFKFWTHIIFGKLNHFSETLASQEVGEDWFQLKQCLNTQFKKKKSKTTGWTPFPLPFRQWNYAIENNPVCSISSCTPLTLWSSREVWEDMSYWVVAS